MSPQVVAAPPPPQQMNIQQQQQLQQMQQQQMQQQLQQQQMQQQMQQVSNIETFFVRLNLTQTYFFLLCFTFNNTLYKFICINIFFSPPPSSTLQLITKKIFYLTIG